MKLIPTRNMAAYLRKIAVDGYVIQVDHIISVVWHYLSVAKRIKRAQPKFIIRNGIREKVYRLNG